LNERIHKQVPYSIVSIIHLLRSTESHSRLTAWFYRWVEHRYLNSVDAFVFNSRDSHARVQAQVRLAKPFVVATPGGDRLKPRITLAQVRARTKTRPLQILFLGNLIRRKAPELLLAAARPLGDRVHVHFAGRTDMEPNTVRRLRAAPKGMRITFYGHIDGAKLSALMSRCHVMALPSSYEGFGIAYLEALGIGLPVIGTHSGAASEIIRHGENGFLIEPGNLEQLTQILKRFDADRKLLVRMSRNALSSFKRHATWRQSMEKIETFLSRYNQPTSPIRLRRRNT
jgi:glycosyltransferase involved in cell wall biosynthesis